MSFCNNNSPDRCPGNINGNPMSGLCEKVCIQVKKVFDACMTQTSLDNTQVTLTSVSPATPTLPLTFVSGASTSSIGQISALTVTPIADSKLSRVQVSIGIPVSISYLDANNVAGTGTGIITLTEDIVMCVPTNGVIPADIAATVNASVLRGAYVSDYVFSVTACVTVILKCEAEVELLIPSYGYCKIPPCQEFTQEICPGVFNAPLFPS